MKRNNIIHNKLFFLFCIYTICSFCQVASGAESTPKIDLTELRAFAMPDNDISLDRNPSGKKVEFPKNVQKIFQSLTDDYFDNQESVVFQIALPDRSQLLFVFVDRYPGGTNSYNFALYDPNTIAVTQNPITLSGSAIYSGDNLLKKPFISFDDIDQDGLSELVIQERFHCGTECDSVIYHYYQINTDLSLKLIFDRPTNIVDYCDGNKCMILKKLKKLSNGRIKLEVMANIKNSKPKLVGEITYARKDMKSPFEAVLYNVIDKDYTFYVDQDLFFKELKAKSK